MKDSDIDDSCRNAYTSQRSSTPSTVHQPIIDHPTAKNLPTPPSAADIHQIDSSNRSVNLDSAPIVSNAVPSPISSIPQNASCGLTTQYQFSALTEEDDDDEACAAGGESSNDDEAESESSVASPSSAMAISYEAPEDIEEDDEQEEDASEQEAEEDAPEENEKEDAPGEDEEEDTPENGEGFEDTSNGPATSHETATMDKGPEKGTKKAVDAEAPKLVTTETGPPKGLPDSVVSPKPKALSAGVALKSKPMNQDKKSIEQRFQKKSQLEHILLRPDTYVGSVEQESGQAWVWDERVGRMTYREITYVPGMYKIFDEILVNAADVKAREKHEERGSKDQPMTKIEVDIDEEDAVISVLNDGAGIPVAIHKEHKIYVPEMIFGHLLTSDNYDDSDKRVTGGRNGYGAKLTNIFSQKFTVEVVDSNRKKKFTMTWTENMTKHSPPKIVDSTSKTDYVKISFTPDLKRFRTNGLDRDLIALMQKRVYDLAGTTGVRVSLNGKKLPVQGFKQYVDLYFSPKRNDDMGDDGDVSDMGDGSRVSKTAVTIFDKNTGQVKIHEKVNDRWEIVVSQSEGQFQQVSFVNSICTAKGGTHVNYVIEPLVNAILKKVSSKNKGGIELKGHHVKNHIFIFVNCLIVNPTFDSQTKETMTLKPSHFGSTCQLADRTVNAVVKSPITESVLLWAQTKQQVDLKRKMKGVHGGSRGRILGVPKLEDANLAGTRHSSECTLILTEGDSAKTSCLAGLSVVGRERYGVFPLRGKLLNVRDASFKQLTENKEIQNILTITGLEAGKKVSDPSELRYGSIMIMTDQDHDGSHIKGLLINFLEAFWPELLKYRGFLKEFVTPIVKVTRGKGQELSFFTIPEYEVWKKENNNGRGWKVKYYKGLGTSNDKEFKEYFSALDEHQLEFLYKDEKDFEAIDMAFNSKRAEDRKAWIQSFKEGTYLDHNEKSVRYKDFVNKELVLFSKYDTERSIPCLVDGLKPGQRKVVFGVIKKNLYKSEMKVAQLASFVSEVSAYHHGENSMEATIVGMAQNFVGANNLALLEPCGQFGSRKEGGKDASATRYIYTKLAIVARHIFHPQDDELLHYQHDEGRVIEPRYYVPVIPMVLVNGAEGIGTGWSSSIPNYNPHDIISNIRCFINGQPMKRMTPWYRGFKGHIERSSIAKGYEAVGRITKVDESTVRITELPVKQWTQPYKDFLDDWMAHSIAEEDAHDNRARIKAVPKRIVAAAKAKAKAKAAAANVKAGRPTSTPIIRQHKCLILDYRDSSNHEDICFEVKLSPDQMKIAEQEGLEKTFRLRRSIPTTNMTLFDEDGKVHCYGSELEILKEFCKLRLDFYHRRKRHITHVLEKEKCLLSNKLKFVLAVIENRLKVSKRKKQDLVNDLRSKGYDTLQEIQERYHVENPTMKGEVGDEGVIKETDESPRAQVDPVIKDYDYLLGMPLWNLTYEKVEDLERQFNEKDKEWAAFKRRTPESLWHDDLSKLEQAIAEMEANLAAQRAKDHILRDKASASGASGRPGTAAKRNALNRLTFQPDKLEKVLGKPSKGPVKAKKPVESSGAEESDIQEEEDSDIESVSSIKPKKRVTKPASASPSKKPKASSKPSSRNSSKQVSSDSDMEETAPKDTSPTRSFSLMQRLRAKMANNAPGNMAGQSPSKNSSPEPLMKRLRRGMAAFESSDDEGSKKRSRRSSPVRGVTFKLNTQKTPDSGDTPFLGDS